MYSPFLKLEDTRVTRVCKIIPLSRWRRGDMAARLGEFAQPFFDLDSHFLPHSFYNQRLPGTSTFQRIFCYTSWGRSNSIARPRRFQTGRLRLLPRFSFRVLWIQVAHLQR